MTNEINWVQSRRRIFIPSKYMKKMLFKELDLIEPILKNLSALGYEKPTPIQAQSIPLVLDGHDVLGCAQTWTGKTWAFSIPVIQILSVKKELSHRSNEIKALILTPTRELALQIDENFREYSKWMWISHFALFGGIKQHSQVRKLEKGVDVLIATPGRLLDLMQQGYISLKHIETLILDEADNMLNMGFINDIKKVLKVIPEKRQTLFFSATMPKEILSLANTILKNPKKVEVAPVSSTVDKIKQEVYHVWTGGKLGLLENLIHTKNIKSVLVFSRTKHGSDKIVRALVAHDITAEAIHGNKSQNARVRALNNFKAGATKVLVATDIAARGIDIDSLAFVVNYDIPNEPETYVHRIGRTGRAGKNGLAMTFCNQEEYAYLLDVEKLISKKLKVIEDHPFEITIDKNNVSKPKRWGGWNRKKVLINSRSGNTGRNRNMRRQKNKRPKKTSS